MDLRKEEYRELAEILMQSTDLEASITILRQFVDQLETRLQWISVEDGLPEPPKKNKMRPDRYRNCFIGKEGVNKKYELLFDEYTGRYTCKIFVECGIVPRQVFLTADEIDRAFHVYNKEEVRIN